MKRSLRTGGTLLSALGIIAVLLLCAGDTAEAAADALHLAATVLVPSLFPFAVLSGFLAARGTAAAWRRPLGRLTARLFHADPGCAAAWAMGWLCGFPIGAAVLAALTARGGIRRDSAARMLPVCSCAGPGFLVTVAGAQLLRSRRAGWLLLLVHLAASLLAGLTLRPAEPPPEAPDPPGDAPPSLPVAFTEAVRGAALAMVQLAGFLVFFSMLLALLRRAAGALGLGAGAVLLLSGLLELTNGLQLLTQTAAPLPLRFLLSAAMLGWSGLCVHAQVLSLALPAGLPARPYLRGKLLHGLYSALLSLLMLPLLAGETAPAAAFPAPAPEDEGLWRAACVALLALFFILLWKSGAGFGIIKKTDQGGGKRHAVR